MDYIISAPVFALISTVLAFIFIVPEKKRVKLNKFGKFLHDTLNFKYLIVEKILQAIYIFSTALVIFGGLFSALHSEGEYIVYSLLIMILGPIAIRLVYEFLMMAILLVKNVIQINNKLKSENNATCFCPNCGTKIENGAFCTNCGSKL